jgi:hypothetical protein
MGAMTREQVWHAISAERDRQDAKWAGPHGWGAGDCSSADVTLPVKVTVLAEEFGEVARAVLERDRAGLKAELIQVAAVAVAMLEGMPLWD